MTNELGRLLSHLNIERYDSQSLLCCRSWVRVSVYVVFHNTSVYVQKEIPALIPKLSAQLHGK